MSRYDGLIIPRSYSEYINKTDAATLQQALQLSGVLSGAVAAGDNKAVKSSAVAAALAGYKTEITKIAKNNSQIISVRSYRPLITITSNHGDIALIFINPWVRGYVLITGAIPADITITHDLYSYDVTITSTTANKEIFIAVN